ncbi:MAG: ketopantoate reductase family protein [Salibacteraceae bacterium]
MATKILFVGIGGVGGFFGGKLAQFYENKPHVEVCFLARGKHLENMHNYGLSVHHLNQHFSANPSLLSDKGDEIGECDYVFFATKNYSLTKVAKQVIPCIGAHTKIITLLNGVSSLDVLEQLFPHNEVINGCVYILSKIKSPGVIENFGNIQKMFFGRNQESVEDLRGIEKIFLDAGIDFKLSDSILEITWSKFVFISAVGTSSSYFDVGIGEILEDEAKAKILTQLLEEVAALGKAKGVRLESSIVQDVISKLKRLPKDTTSSMQRDFRNGSETEIDSLTHFVINEAKDLGVAVPTYNELYNDLIKKLP